MPAHWPLWLRRLMQATTTYFAQSYELIRQRTAGNASPLKRVLAERDDALLDAALLRREIGVLRRNRARLPHERRPHYAPEDRREILQIMRLRGWSFKKTAKRFVLHRNTVAAWQRAWAGKKKIGLFFGRVPWNRIADGIRWAVHEIRSLVPEPEFGTRTIVMHLIRCGIRISRSTVQRILREKRPARPARRTTTSQLVAPAAPFFVLRPPTTNHTWHLDLTTFEFLFVRFYVAAVIDGFSRRLLALKVFPDAPRTAGILRMLRHTIAGYGAPRYLVTDHGCQFQHRFKDALKARFGITLVKGRLQSHHTNGKVERFFRTLKWWQRMKLLFVSEKSISEETRCFQKLVQHPATDVDSGDAHSRGSVERNRPR